MRPFTLLSLLGCVLSTSVTAAQVQVFPATYASPKKPTAAEAVPTAVARASASGSRPLTSTTTEYLAPRRVTSGTQFTFRDSSGKIVSAPVLSGPVAKIDRRLSPALLRAASIAQERAHAHSKSRCWRYVKGALMASGAISSYPKTALAKHAGDELVRDYGFKKLAIRDPYAAPVGAVLVYGARRAAGHVEIRTRTGFVSDFENKKPSPRPLIGVYAKI